MKTEQIKLKQVTKSNSHLVEIMSRAKKKKSPTSTHVVHNLYLIKIKKVSDMIRKKHVSIKQCLGDEKEKLGKTKLPYWINLWNQLKLKQNHNN